MHRPARASIVASCISTTIEVIATNQRICVADYYWIAQHVIVRVYHKEGDRSKREEQMGVDK
jgi:hypothetical protein